METLGKNQFYDEDGSLCQYNTGDSCSHLQDNCFCKGHQWPCYEDETGRYSLDTGKNKLYCVKLIINNVWEPDDS